MSPQSDGEHRFSSPHISIFLGQPAVGFEAEWADFQRAASESEEAALAQEWWRVEQGLLDTLLQHRPGEERGVDVVIGEALRYAVRSKVTLSIGGRGSRGGGRVGTGALDLSG